MVNCQRKELNNFFFQNILLLLLLLLSSLLNSKYSFYFILLLSLLIFSFVGSSFSQVNDSGNNIDKAKLSSDEAISLIDSLKGSSLLDSVTSGMGNFSLSGVNKSNITEPKIMSNDSVKNSSINVVDKNVTTGKIQDKTPAQQNSSNDLTKGNSEFIQPLLVLPYPMSIQSKDYIPLYSSMPSKISNGTILTKLPCDKNSKPTLQIVGSSADNNIFPLNLDLISNLSKADSMCMYKSVFPEDLANPLYSHTLTNIYLYNSLDAAVEVPTTTSIFIGIHKLSAQ
jgi:hypothetical protein